MELDLAALSTALDTANRKLVIYVEAKLPLGLEIVELAILRELLERDEQHPTELAQAVGRVATSFTPILDKLELKGFVERKKDPHDRRAVFICLTDKARAEIVYIKRAIKHDALKTEELLQLVNNLMIINRITE